MTKEIDQSWDEFLTELSPKDDKAVLEKIYCPLEELFDRQANVDRAKKALFKPMLGQLFKLYLSQIDLHTLSDKMNVHRSHFVRGLGRDRFNHLKLLVRLKIIDQDKKPRKGLLAV